MVQFLHFAVDIANREIWMNQGMDKCMNEWTKVCVGRLCKTQCGTVYKSVGENGFQRWFYSLA